MASGIGKRLFNSTADLATALDARSNAPADPDKPAAPRTAPGNMIAARGEMLSMQRELTELREKLQQHDGSLATIKLDPKIIKPTRWANRHESSFETAAFARLKSSIELAAGNTQPILVRTTEQPGGFEVVFGHRRHRACLELGLPILAVVWNGPMPDLELFLSMDRENREREDPSAYEQGVTYLAALDANLFQSQRRLAEAIGASHTWVRKAIMVAQLPPAIIDAFPSPLEIQARYAQEIETAIAADKKSVLRRAERIRQLSKRLSASQVCAQLVGRTASAGPPEKLIVGKRTVGTWRKDGKGRAVITLDASCSDNATIDAILKELTHTLSARPEG
ncbi:MAG: ParB/RepB/Spo0J family partition protein [Betaproteobacteria bacterium]